MNSVGELLENAAMGAYFSEALQRIENALSGYLPNISTDLSTSCPSRLAAAMQYSTLSGGKRLRPILCLMATEACGGDCEIALPAACALEMVHTYSLIHDDLPAMDNDDIRRGKLTCHRAFDEATAILTGDGLLTLAFELLAREIKPESVALRCIAILGEASGTIGMVGGQMADLQAGQYRQNNGEKTHSNSLSKVTESLCTLESIHRRKTGALVTAPLQIGAVIAGASELCVNAFDRYGKALGLAFQIVDDLLDVQGEQAKLGKRVGKDMELGKWTYPRFLGIDGSRHRARELAEEAAMAITLFGPLGDRLRYLALALLERDH
jgi:geranylgeranyl diphosphate synthase, type II